MLNALTIAGSDSCGGAGIQADLKTFMANGIYGMSVITSVTAQNTMGVHYVQDLEPLTIKNQLEAIFDDIKVDAIKIGMLSNNDTINTVASTLQKYSLPRIVLDPVMISKHGYPLLSEESIQTLIDKLLPLATVITPNIPEAEVILGVNIKDIDDMKNACKQLYKLGPKYILIKGGHLESGESTDVLYDGHEFYTFEHERIDVIHTHGTGCTLSSAIAANLSRGCDIVKAVSNAKKYVTLAIQGGFALGKGIGPTNHLVNIKHYCAQEG